MNHQSEKEDHPMVLVVSTKTKKEHNKNNQRRESDTLKDGRFDALGSGRRRPRACRRGLLGAVSGPPLAQDVRFTQEVETSVDNQNKQNRAMSVDQKMVRI